MGPSTGSPAAETQKNQASSLTGRSRGRRARWFPALRGLGAALLLASSSLPATPCWARTAETSHTLTVVVVQPALSITDDTGDFSLSMDRGDAGSSSNTQVVTYRVHGNNLPTGAVDGILSAKISRGPEGISIQADVGGFTNEGSSGNIDLQEHASGFQEVSLEPVPLADKEANPNAQAKALNGNIPIGWKATATKDLPAGSHPVVVTVTLKDS